VAGLELERWEPLSPAGVAALLAPCPAPWWIAGGYAIDAFVGHLDRRTHEDIDVGLLASDQQELRGCLAGWELYCADPPGTLRPWRAGEALAEPIHDVWGRPGAAEPWRLALVLNTSEGPVWTYRRDPRVRRPLSELVWRSDDVPYLVPEVQLLFKSKTLRPKDELDFEDAAPLLAGEQRAWLRAALELAHPGHPWARRL
jgi:Aminoglycoside-2''-adenylyltransferase